MNEKLPPFLKREKDSILFNSEGEFYFYIPEKMFDLNIARYEGDIISTLGIMPYAMKDAKGKMGTLHEFNYPTRFATKPYKVEKLKGVRIIKQSKPSDYRVLCYKKGDPIIVNIFVEENLTNAEDLTRLFIMAGSINNTIPYDQLQNYFVNNYKYNGKSYGITLQLFGIIVSEICRSSTDESKPFRLSGSNDMHNYRSIPITSIPRIISAYSAITSNNFNQAMVYASLNKKQIESPLERVLTGEDV
ncbi:MAG: hypothetical protein IJ193_00640 [Bacilli bacterium]|nr:hypothetical protein [Bacilli bacterium]